MKLNTQLVFEIRVKIPHLAVLVENDGAVSLMLGAKSDLVIRLVLNHL